VCVSQGGDAVLVADQKHLTELSLIDWSMLRQSAQTLLSAPQLVDCNEATIAVISRPSVVLMHHSSPMGGFEEYRRFSLVGTGLPTGLCLLANGAGLAVCDYCNNRLQLYSLEGVLQSVIDSRDGLLVNPYDVVHCSESDRLIVACYTGDTVTAVRKDGTEMEAHSDEQVKSPTALCVLPTGGVLVRTSSHLVFPKL
jgi:hypothetical protein